MARCGDAPAGIAHGCQENVSQSLLDSSSGQAGKRSLIWLLCFEFCFKKGF